MTLNNPKTLDALSGPVIFDNDSRSSVTESNLHVVDKESKQNKLSTNAYLDIPTSRPSLESAFSDFSELSYHSNDPETHHPLIRRLSRSYQQPTTITAADRRPPRSRVGSALHSFYVANYGAFLVLLSQFFGSLMNVATRLLETPGSHGAPMHPFQILFARQSITAFLCTTFALTTKSIPDFPLGPKGTVRYLLVIRGLCGFFGVFGLYFSLLYLPLSEATVLTFLAPILTCYMCSLLIPGETFSRQQQLAGYLSLVGVVFISQPASLFTTPAPPTNNPPISNSTFPSSPSNTTTSSSPSYHQPITPTPSQHLTAIGVAMLGVLGATGAMTSIRSIGTRAHPFLSINYFSVWCSIVSLMALLIFPSVHFRFPGNALEWGLLATLGLCGFIMQFLLTAGLSYGGPSLASSSAAAATTTAAAAKLKEERLSTAADGTTHTATTTTSIPSSSSSSSPHDTTAKDMGSPLTRTQSQTKTANLKKGSGTRATSMVYTQMLFALAGDKFVFGVSPGVMSWIGSGLILAGAVWVAAARDKKVKTVGVVVGGGQRGSGGGGAGTPGQDPSDERSLDNDEENTGGMIQRGKNFLGIGKRKGERGGDDIGEEEETVGLMSAAEPDDHSDHHLYRSSSSGAPGRADEEPERERAGNDSGGSIQERVQGIEMHDLPRSHER